LRQPSLEAWKRRADRRGYRPADLSIGREVVAIVSLMVAALAGAAAAIIAGGTVRPT
jgi:hypothetical protein